MPVQTAASMDIFVSVQGKVINSTSSGFIPQLLVLTQNPILPTNTMQQFTTAAAITAYFGNSSYNDNPIYSDSANAAFYFKGGNKGNTIPPSILFYRYVDSDTGAFTRGTALTAAGLNNDLTKLKLVTAGTLNLTFNDTEYNVIGIDLHTYTSFNAMAAAIETAIQLVSGLSTVTCTWDSTTNAFTITFPYDSDNANTVGYVALSGTGSTDQLAQRMKITQAAGAVLSQGLAAQTVEQIMDAAINLNRNFIPFLFNFDINSDPDYSIVLQAIAWNEPQSQLFIPFLYDTQAGSTSPITNPMQQAIIAAGYGQDSVAPYTLSATLMYFIVNDTAITLPFSLAGVIASYNFNTTNGIILTNASTFTGITPIVNNNNDANLVKNVYNANSYFNLNTRANNFQWFETGVIGGQYGWIDTLVGYIWLADKIQVEVATLMQSLNEIPYDNLSLINSVVDPVFNQGLSNGVVQTNIPLSSTQIQELIQEAGADISSILYTNGYYFPAVTATADDIANRSLSNVQGWFTYAGGPVTIAINLNVLT